MAGYKKSPSKLMFERIIGTVLNLMFIYIYNSLQNSFIIASQDKLINMEREKSNGALDKCRIIVIKEMKK